MVCVWSRDDEHVAAQMQACVLKVCDILADERDEEEGGMAASYLRLFAELWSCPGRKNCSEENTSSI